MGEAFKDAIITLEITRDKNGKWWTYSHYHSDKHFNMDEEDLQLIQEFQEKINKVGVSICEHLIEAHPNKTLVKSRDDWRDSQSLVYDKETGKGVVFNKEGEVTSSSMSDEEIEKRMTPEAWENYKRWRDERRTNQKG